ncbi:hypothetical protein [Candidatus Phytoplasma pruni]|uniref:Uncharacterized protein n=1 Tax=Candidatus Phytoplasma pruni TaxID=479893 RepID=A0A851HI22_9MOLU|nr:hypothetical protein [Candidatus Phytoplasma pruni]NWN45954.1 hypothetical protein [Candidatus Phytoplasma pruni]
MKKNNKKNSAKTKKNNKTPMVVKKTKLFTVTNLVILLAILVFSLVPILAIYEFVTKK